MSIRPTILVFDSGAGGLSIAREITKRLPDCKLIYAADNAYFPYGLMDDEHLSARVLSVMASLLEQFSPDIAVIACNTASTIALEALRSRFSTPFVGVVPAIKPAAKSSSSSVFGLLATPATVEREYTDNLVNDFADHCEVIRLGSSKLVEYAENEILGNPATDEELNRELDKLRALAGKQAMDTVVLACTHFPLLKSRFSRLGNWQGVQWIDSGEAIARRVAFLLEHTPMPIKPNGSLPPVTLYFSATQTEPHIHNAYESYLSGQYNSPL